MNLNLFRRARLLLSDPAKGIEYNKFIMNRKVSKCIYSVDIARNPHLIGYNGDGIIVCDIQAKARLVNSCRSFVDNEARKIKGRDA